MTLANATVLNAAEQLYRGTDFSSLSRLEQLWAAWYISIGNPIIATGLMSFILHEVRSFAVALLFLLTPTLGCLLWSLCSVDYYRCNSLLSAMEAPTQQGPHTARTMGMHKAGPLLSFHNRTSCCQYNHFLSLDTHPECPLDLAIPPSG
jgi:hypothetical protein